MTKNFFLKGRFNLVLDKRAKLNKIKMFFNLIRKENYFETVARFNRIHSRRVHVGRRGNSHRLAISP